MDKVSIINESAIAIFNILWIIVGFVMAMMVYFMMFIMNRGDREST